jgi:hypothetical protein
LFPNPEGSCGRPPWIVARLPGRRQPHFRRTAPMAICRRPRRRSRSENALPSRVRGGRAASPPARRAGGEIDAGAPTLQCEVLFGFVEEDGARQVCKAVGDGAADLSGAAQRISCQSSGDHENVVFTVAYQISKKRFGSSSKFTTKIRNRSCGRSRPMTSWGAFPVSREGRWIYLRPSDILRESL